MWGGLKEMGRGGEGAVVNLFRGGRDNGVNVGFCPSFDSWFCC